MGGDIFVSFLTCRVTLPVEKHARDSIVDDDSAEEEESIEYKALQVEPSQLLVGQDCEEGCRYSDTVAYSTHELVIHFLHFCSALLL